MSCLGHHKIFTLEGVGLAQLLEFHPARSPIAGFFCLAQTDRGLASVHINYTPRRAFRAFVPNGRL